MANGFKIEGALTEMNGPGTRCCWILHICITPCGLLRPVRNSFILNWLRVKAPSVPVWRNGSATDL